MAAYASIHVNLWVTLLIEAFLGALDMSDSELVTTQQVAIRFGVTVETICRWVRKGKIPCIRPSRRTMRFRLKDVEVFLSQARAGESD